MYLRKEQKKKTWISPLCSCLAIKTQLNNWVEYLLFASRCQARWCQEQDEKQANLPCPGPSSQVLG